MRGCVLGEPNAHSLSLLRRSIGPTTRKDTPAKSLTLYQNTQWSAIEHTHITHLFELQGLQEAVIRHVTQRLIRRAVQDVGNDAGAQVGQLVLHRQLRVRSGARGSRRTGHTACCTGGATTCTVTGLTNGTSYTFKVSDTNGVGGGAGGVGVAEVEITLDQPVSSRSQCHACQ